MSLLFNMLSRLVIAFLPRIKCLLISWLQSPSVVILEHKKTKSVTVSIVCPSICHEVMGQDVMILVFWMLSFKPTFSLSSFTFIKRFSNSSLLSAIRVVSSAYLSLFLFLPVILILACTSSSLAFCMMYSAYKLSKQGDNIQSWHTPFPMLSQSVFPVLLTIAKIWKQPMSTDKKVVCVCIYTYINIFIRFFMRPLRRLRIIVNEEQDNIGLLKNVIEMSIPLSSSFKSQFTGLYLWETAFDSSR